MTNQPLKRAQSTREQSEISEIEKHTALENSGLKSQNQTEILDDTSFNAISLNFNPSQKIQELGQAAQKNLHCISG